MMHAGENTQAASDIVIAVREGFDISDAKPVGARGSDSADHISGRFCATHASVWAGVFRTPNDRRASSLVICLRSNPATFIFCLRAFMRADLSYNYANWLQLNPQEMVRLFNEARGEPEVVYRPQPVGRQVNTSGPISPNFVVIVFVIGILSVVAAWGYSLLVQTPPKKPIIDVPTVAATPTAIAGASALISTTAISPTAGAGTIRIPTTVGTTTGTTTGTTPAAAGASSAAAGTTVATGAAGTTVSPTPATSLKVIITSSVKSWVEIYADGDKNAKSVGYINPGESREIDARQTVTIYCGKPDNVTYNVNGVDKGTLPKEALQTQGFTISL